MRDAGGFDDVVGDVPRGELFADGALDAVAEGVVEGGAGGEVDEERHPVAAVGEFQADDEGLADLGEPFDRFVDVGGAHPDALAVEGGVGAAVDDDAAAGGDGDPVAVPPDSGVHVEVAVVVAGAVGVVPEAGGHGRHGVGDDEFTDFVDDRFALRVPGL